MNSAQRFSNRRTLKFALSQCAIVALACASIFAQDAKRTQTTTPAPEKLAVVETAGQRAPQVVTVVHRLSGLKVLALLRRAGEPVAEADEEIVSSRNLHTSITAGFLLGDGRSIVTRLPQAEVEIETPAESFAAQALSQFPPTSNTPLAAGTLGFPKAVTLPNVSVPELTILGRDGQSFNARYVGLDGATGLSVLQIEGLKVQPVNDAQDDEFREGRRVRLLAPEQAGNAANAGTLLLRQRLIEGKIEDVTHLPTGRVASLTVRAEGLSSAVAGGVAMSDAGEMLGIVESSSANVARIVPAWMVRRAAERVLARRASVPRPWLGVRGEAVSSVALDKLLSNGWPSDPASSIVNRRAGILLTSVLRGTPAASANLRPGDVILSINDQQIKSVEEFTELLSEAGNGAAVRFNVLRPEAAKSLPVVVTLGEALNPSVAVEREEARARLLEEGASMTIEVQRRMSEQQRAAEELRRVEKQLREVTTNLKEHEKLVREAQERWREAEARFHLAETLARRARESALLSETLDLLTVNGTEAVMLKADSARLRGARSGLLVIAVHPDSASSRAGLQRGDVIETLNGNLLSANNLLPLQDSRNLSKLQLGIVRAGSRIEITLPIKTANQQK